MQSKKDQKSSTRLRTVSFIGTALLLSFASACARVKIKDQEFCADKGTLGARCARTLTAGTRSVPKEQWDNERFGNICEKPEVFADWKQIIEEQCSYHGNCDYEEVQKALNFLSRAERGFE